MGRYADLARIIDGIPEQTLIWLSNDDPQATTHNLSVINRIIADAEDIVDDTLRSRYTLPLPTVSTSVGRITVSIARHDLYARRPETPVPVDVVRTYRVALDWLEQIQECSKHLGDSLQVDIPDGGGFRIRASAKKFSDDALAGY